MSTVATEPKPSRIRLSITIPRAGAVGSAFNSINSLLQIENFDQFRNALARLQAAGADDFRLAAPLDRVQPFLGKLAQHHVRIGIGRDRSC